MLLKEILKPGLVTYKPDLNSKKQVLQYISSLVAEQTPWTNNKAILQCFLKREKISSTAIGHGVAIPHCRIDDLKSPIGCLVTLKNNIDFDSIDSEPVKIVFALMVPEENHEQHLKLLAEIANLLNNKEVRENIVNITEDSQLLEYITNIDF